MMKVEFGITIALKMSSCILVLLLKDQSEYILVLESTFSHIS